MREGHDDVLAQISAAWSRRYPRRASGGTWALTGFAYQFHVSILRLIQAHLAAASPSFDAATVEELSDVAIVGGDSLQVIQVKRRLTGPSLRAALAEVLSIVEVAEEIDPAWLAFLRFSVTAQTDASDSQRTVDAWLESMTDLTRRAWLREAVTLTIEPSPFVTILTLLHNEYQARDAVRLVERWVGDLTVDPSTAPRRIWSDLTELAQHPGNRPPGSILGEEDRAPAEVTVGRVLTGQQPRLRDLRSGSFARRDHRIAALTEEVRIWAEANPALEAGLRVLWMVGRSGSGKSVALMQTAAMLRLTFPGPIVWLGPEHRALPEAVRWATEIQRLSGEPVLLVVDDPYATSDASEIWRDAAGEVMREIETGDVDAIPLILACGPAEQARRLRDDHMGVVATTELELPEATDADWSELRSFYRARTTHEPPVVAHGDNILLVQAFFEWRERLTLPEFAQSFKQRVKQIDTDGSVEHYVTMLLASNRLYAGLSHEVSSAILDARGRDALSVLWDDDHLSAVPEESGGRPGVWLAHPHLSTAIYNSWFPANSAHHQRVAHLVEAWRLEREQDAGARSSLLGALARLGRADSADRETRIPDEELTEVLTIIWREEHSSDADLLAVLPTWVDLAATHRSIALDPDPRDVAIEEVELRPPALEGGQPPDLAVVLARHVARDLGGRGPRARRVLERMLVSAKERPEAWAVLAATVAGHSTSPSLADAYLDWIERNGESSLAATLAEHAARVEDRRQRVLSVYLAHSRPTAAWARVAAAVADRDPQDVITEQLRNDLPDWRSGHLLTAMLDRHRLRDPSLLRGWLRMHDRSPLAGSVLQAALSAGWAGDRLVGDAVRRSSLAAPLLAESISKADASSADRAVADGIQWLGRAVSPGWPEVWEACWARSTPGPDRDRLLEALAKALDGAALVSVRVRCWNVAVDRDLFVDQQEAWGIALARAAVGDRSWAAVFETAWSRWPEHRDVLLETAWRHLDHPAIDGFTWAAAWCALFTHLSSTGDAALHQRAAALGRRFLGRPVPARGFGRVWQELTGSGEPDDELRSLGRQALDGPPHADLIRVLVKLWRSARGDPHLTRIGADYMRTMGAHRGISYLATELLAHDPSPDVIQLGLALVATEHGNDGVPHIIEALDEAGAPTRDLVQAGCEFLRARPDHRGIGHVWLTLLRRAPTDPRLIEIGLWLVRQHPEGEIGEILERVADRLSPGERESIEAKALENPLTKTFEHLWPRAWEATPGDAHLVELGRRYLREVRHGDGFGYVWPRLWDHRKDAELREIGIAHLLANPTHRGFGHVFLPLWSQKANRPRIAGVGLDLLRTQLGHRAFGVVWKELWSDPDDPAIRIELSDLGARHIHSHPRHTAFTWIWLTLLRECPDRRADLIELGFSYLGIRPHLNGFVTVFEHLWSDPDLRNRLSPEGLAFVASGSARASHTWLLLDRHDPQAPGLRAAGLRLLAARSFQPQAFGQMWTRLATNATDPPDHAALRVGAEMLIETRPPDGSAASAWAYLFESDGLTPSLQAAGERIVAHNGHALPRSARSAFAAAGFDFPPPPTAPSTSWLWFTCCKCWEQTGAMAPDADRFTVRTTCHECEAYLVVRRRDGHVTVELDAPRPPSNR